MRSRTVFLALFFISSLALPLIAYAGVPFFGPIIPPNLQSCPIGWAGVIDVANRVISFLITLGIVFFAPLMVAWAGFLFVLNPYDPGYISKAKGILWHTVLGIVVALVGYMIVAALMAVLYNASARIPGTTNGVLGVWTNLIGSGGQSPCIDLRGVTPTVTPPPPPPVVTVPGQVVNGFVLGCSTSNDDNARILAAAGISGRSSGNCCDRTRSTCTSLDGMPSNTVQQIINVKNKCGATTVTGGTEVGHASEGGTGSHSSGSKVDLGQNLISCIENTSGRVLISSPSFGSSQVQDRCGNVYTWEGNHTDIYVRTSCVLTN